MSDDAMKEIITVSMPRSKYLALLNADEKLNRLEAGGVDNWVGYGESLNPDEGEDCDTACEKNKILVMGLPTA